jgi:hypothetical protein
MCVCARACTRLPLPAAERPVGSRDGGHAALALGTRPHLPRRTLGHPTCALDRIAARVFSSGNPATLWSCDTASAHARRARTRRVARNEGSPHGEEGDERRVGRRRRPANIRAAHRLVAAVVVGRVQLSTASEPCSMRIPSRSLDAPRATRHSHTRVAHDLTRTLECTDESKSWTTRASIHLCVNCSAEF